MASPRRRDILAEVVTEVGRLAMISPSRPSVFVEEEESFTIHHVGRSYPSAHPDPLFL